MDGSVTFNPIIEEWPNHPKANRGSSVTPKQQFFFFFYFLFLIIVMIVKGDYIYSYLITLQFTMFFHTFN
jgi:hypothetical protein